MHDDAESNENRAQGESSSCPPHCCDHLIDRRTFVQMAGAGAAAVSGIGTAAACAGPFNRQDTVDHFIPIDKKLSADWVRSLFAKGGRSWIEGAELETVGMPVGGICAGQVYLTGDGRLRFVDIFNQYANSGYGSVNYREGRTATEMVVNGSEIVEAPSIDQGFALHVETEAGTIVRSVDARGFSEVRFCGEYPIGLVEFADADFPVSVRLEAFSPFIPLNEADSALPAALLKYTLENVSADRVKVTLAGWLENAVCYHTAREDGIITQRLNREIRGDGLTAVLASARLEEEPRPANYRPPVVFADFEGTGYGDWQVEGDAFGTAPARGTLPDQQAVSGFQGEGLVNTYLGGDAPTGRLISPEFIVERPWIAFFIGGGAQDDQTCINLVVDGSIVRTATGRNSERLEPHNWNVEELAGRRARIEIVDTHSGGWGHINIDQIEFRDDPMRRDLGDLALRPDIGTMALALLGDGATYASAVLPSGAMPEALFAAEGLQTQEISALANGEPRRGAVGRTFDLGTGETAEATFVVSWHMPNLYFRDSRVGNHYGGRFGSAADVVQYVAADSDRLVRDTKQWHDTWYDSTLPWWLLFRIHSTVSNLATATTQWWQNERFWAYEGCGCCHGTCGHVWNYAHGLARLFPALERSVREMQDFAPGVGFISETGEIRFRGEDWSIWAGDAQGGYIMKAWREHLCSADDAFLRRNWPRIKQALQFLIQEDGNADGLLEGRQHQTYDQDYYGANTMVGSLYLGALRAGEEMAREMGDAEFASTCRTIFETGSRNSVERLFNGEYFVQDVDLEQHPDWQYGDGCLADQLFGQGWAHQVGLGYVYPQETVLQALESIWKYCWAPDIALQNQRHEPERWFAYPGEAGLFTCTWPKSRHMGPRSTRYRNEVWTGIEYQVANHMASEGMLTEALAICRAVHDRYHPAKRNPFNEIECGDHYARALASWGVLIGLSGFEYHGPKGRIGFAPRITPEDFRAAFTGAEAWGSLAQVREGNRQTDTIAVAWGRLPVREVTLALDPGQQARTVTVDGASIGDAFTQTGKRLSISLPTQRVVRAGQALEVVIET